MFEQDLTGVCLPQIKTTAPRPSAQCFGGDDAAAKDSQKYDLVILNRMSWLLHQESVGVHISWLLKFHLRGKMHSLNQPYLDLSFLFNLMHLKNSVTSSVVKVGRLTIKLIQS